MLNITLQEAVLSVFVDVPAFSENRRYKIFTRNACSKERLISIFKNNTFSIFKSSRSQWKVAIFLATIRIFEFLLEVDITEM